MSHDPSENWKWKWHDVTYSQVWWPILGIRALHLTHPKCTHTAVNTHTHTHTHTVNTHLEQWAAIYAAAPGEQLGVRCLAQGHLSRGIEGGERALYIHSPHLQSLPDRDSNSQPFDYKSDSLTHWSQTQFLEGHSSAQICSNPNQTHLIQLIKVFRITRNFQAGVSWSWLELNSAELPGIEFETTALTIRPLLPHVHIICWFCSPKTFLVIIIIIIIENSCAV